MHATSDFVLSRDDFARFQRLAVRRLCARRDVLAVRGIATAVLWVLMASSLFIIFKAAGTHPAEASVFYLLAVLFGLALLLAQMLPHLVAMRLRKALVAEGGAFLRPRSLQFSDDSLTTCWATGRAERHWSNFIGRAADEVNHYLFVDACDAVIVPRRAVEAFQADFDRHVAPIRAI